MGTGPRSPEFKDLPAVLVCAPLTALRAYPRIQRPERGLSFLEFPRAVVFLIGPKKRSLIGPQYFSLIGQITAVIGVFDWPISAGFDWTTKQHNNREIPQTNRGNRRVKAPVFYMMATYATRSRPLGRGHDT